MSIIYNLPIVRQGGKYLCWIMAPSIVSACGNTFENYTKALLKHKKKITELKGTDYLGSLKKKEGSEGLPPEDLDAVYKCIGFRSISENTVDELAQKSEVELAQDMEKLLKNEVLPIVQTNLV